MNNLRKRKQEFLFRLCCWSGRYLYRFRMWLERHQDFIDGLASRYDPEAF